MTAHDGLRAVLRQLPVLAGTAPPFAPASAPDGPVELFTEWFDQAVAAGVAEPHAMTVSTVDEHGRPSARVLILKAVDAAGWHFAVSTVSRKGRDLDVNPVAALTFYWTQLGRQIRVAGSVQQDPRSVAEADFLARSAGSREMALTRRQSQPYSDPAELDTALQDAAAELTAAPDTVPDEWVSYAVRAETVEFWQSDRARKHVRLLYTRNHDGWVQTRLWP
jgi:pyridoxamine 5'-phosphate oxidase